MSIMLYVLAVVPLLWLASSVVADDPAMLMVPPASRQSQLRTSSASNNNNSSLLLLSASSSSGVRNLVENTTTTIADDGGPSSSSSSSVTTMADHHDTNSLGKWGPFFDMTLISIHSMILPDNQLLVYGSDDKARQGGLVYEVWDVRNGAGNHELSENHILMAQTSAQTNIFCTVNNIDVSTGHPMLMGGDNDWNRGVTDILEFDTYTHELRYHPKGNMNYERWYGTSVILEDGQVFIVGGIGIDNFHPSDIPEVFHPERGWRELPNARIPSITFPWGILSQSWWYPHTFVNSKGEIIIFSHGFFTGYENIPPFLVQGIQSHTAIYKVGITGDGGTRKLIGTKPFASHHLGPSIMYRQDHILFLDNQGYLWDCNILKQRPTFQRLLNTGYIRTNGSMVILPDGRIALIGGCEELHAVGNTVEGAILSIQIYNPETNTIYTGPTQDVPRLYHSSSMILPDGSITSAGGGAPGPLKNANGQVYYPGYLFDSITGRELVPEERPIITCFPRNVQSGTIITIQVQVQQDNNSTSIIERITTTKPGSMTHARNSETRWFDLEYTILPLEEGEEWEEGAEVDTNKPLVVQTIQVQLPPGNVMLPGLWNLNVINKQGVPSIASLMGVNMASIPPSGIPSCSVDM